MTTIKFIQVRDDKTPQNLESTLAEQIAKKGLIEIHDESHPNHLTTDALLTYSIEGDPFVGVLALAAKPKTVRFLDYQGNITQALAFPIQESIATQGKRFYTLRFHFPEEGPRMSAIFPDQVEFTVDPYPDEFEVKASITGDKFTPVEAIIPIKIVYEKETVNG